jgi:hypothetical protein
MHRYTEDVGAGGYRPAQSVKLIQRRVNGIVLPFVWLVDLSGVGGSQNGNIEDDKLPTDVVRKE